MIIYLFFFFLAICETPNRVISSESNIPLSVICDNIREPGNLGAVIRSCAGAGVQRIFLPEGTLFEILLWNIKTKQRIRKSNLSPLYLL